MPNDNRRANTPTAALPSWQQQILEWVYVNQQDKFYLTEDPTNPVHQLKPHQFDLEFQHLVPVQGKQKGRTKPSNLIQRLNPETNMVTALGMFPAIRDRLVVLPRGTALNIHDPIPTYKVDKPRHPQVILDHLNLILDKDKKHIDHVLQFICHMVFRPETRINHGLLVSGAHRTGKSSIGKLVSKLIGVGNTNEPSMQSVKSNFQDWAPGKRLILIHEVKESNNHNLDNHLKSFITEDKLDLNIKYGSITIDNHLHFMMFSNHRYPFPMEEGNRRIWYVHSNATRQTKEYYDQFHRAVGVGDEIGPEIPHFYHYLKTRVLPLLPSNFAYAGSPLTVYSTKAVEASKNPVAELLEDALAEAEGLFEPGVWFERKQLMKYLRDPERGASHMMRNSLEVQSTLEKYGLRERKRCKVHGKKRNICWFESDASKDLHKLFYLHTKDAQREKKARVFDPFREIYDGYSEFESIDDDEDPSL